MKSRGREASTGEMRNLLTIQRAILTQAADGAVVQTWVEFKQVWANVDALTGRERYIAEGTAGVIEYAVPIKRTEGIERSMRMRWGSQTFDINAVLPVQGQRKQLKLLCTERL